MLEQIISIGYDGSHQNISVAIHVLGQRMHDDIGSEVQRLLNQVNFTSS